MAYIDTKYIGECETCRHHSNGGCNTYCDHGEEYSPNLSKIPTADVVEVETIKAWLYKMAINNVGCVLDGDFSNACEEIISRLDGLRSFARERTPKERGGEK
jgi:hypothetical protein